MAPDLWNQVGRAVDASGQPGQFLLTGSAVPADVLRVYNNTWAMDPFRPVHTIHQGVEQRHQDPLPCWAEG